MNLGDPYHLFILYTVCDVWALFLQVHRDETTGNILNLVMVQADEGMMLKVNLPVEFKGEGACPGLKKGITFPISIAIECLHNK
jgi:hypothetical protein